MIGPSPFQQVRALFSQALDQAPERREQFVRDQDAPAEIREQVLALLREESTQTFLEPPDEWEPAPRVRDRDAAIPAIDGFRIVRTIGTGGSGIVFEAVQDTPRRTVALKLLRADRLSSRRLQRFREEAEILARLNHPGIAQVYMAGVQETETGPRPFIALELVEDARDLVRHARERCSKLSERLALFAKLVDAVQHAHRQGVIHRDLKAANVLVGSSGQPKVIDYGIARDLDREAPLALTQEGDLLGTLASMAPEQLGGKAAVDTRTDVYALGLLLYEVLFDQPPFDFAGCSLTEVVEKIQQASPRPPSSRDGVPIELDWIVRRALEKDADRRYESVAQLAEDLRRFQDHEPLLASPPGALYPLGKFVRRHRVLVGAAAVAVVALVGGAGLALAGMLTARAESRRAQEESDNFRSINEVLRGVFLGAQIESGGYDVRASVLIDRAAVQIGDRFASRPDLEAPLRLLLAQSLASCGRPREAQREAQRARLLFDGLGADFVESRLASSLVVAESLLVRGETGEALQRTSEVIDQAQAQEVRPDASSGLALRALHLLLRGCFEPREASLIEDMTGLAEVARETLGANDPVTDQILLRLAELYGFASDAETAHSIVAKVAQRRTQEFGSGDPRTCQARQLQAQFLVTCDRWEEAAELLKTAASDLESTHGPEHPRAVAGRMTLGTLLQDLGRYRESKTVLEPLVERSIEIFGSTHSRTFRAQFALAVTRARLGEDVEEEYRQLLERARGTELEPGAACQRVRLFLASLLDEGPPVDEAREIMEEYLAIRRSFSDPVDAELLEGLAFLANHHRARGDLERARPYFVELTSLLRERYGPLGNPDTAAMDRGSYPPWRRLQLVARHAEALAELGRGDEALEQIEPALDALEVTPDLTAGVEIEILRIHGQCLVAAELPEEALDELWACLDRTAARHGAGHPAVRALREDVRALLRRLGREAEADELGRRP